MSFIPSRGSEWRKCDLHIHTPISLCSEYGGNTEDVWTRFFEELERLSESIKIIGINDYLFLDGYKKVLDYKKKGGLKKVELLLPVIEFRLKEFVGSKDLQRLNYHIIFADESILSTEVIETHFLAGLKGKANLDENLSTNISWGGVVTRDSLIDFGQKIYETTPEDKRAKLAKSYLSFGFDNINFEISKIEELLGETGDPNLYLKGKYFKAIGKAEWEAFRWDSSPGQKKSIINCADFIFTASPSIVEANNGYKSLKENGVNSRLLHCSDAHKFSLTSEKTKPKELGHCFTWVKANSTFEGLKEAITEYELRVRIQDSNPNQKIPYEVIQEVRFVMDQAVNPYEFSPKPIMLNPDLNTIIGGKSCGKSLLIYSIANTTEPIQVLSKREYGVEEKKQADKYAFFDRKIDFEVTWANGEKQLLSQNRLQSNSNYSILYIPQSYIQKLADTEGRKTRKEVGKIIRDILLQKETYKKFYQDFIKNVKRLDVRRENIISQYITALEVYNTSQRNIHSIGDKNAIGQYIRQIQSQIQKLKNESQISEDQQKNYDELTTALKDVQTYRFELKTNRAKIEAFKYSLEKSINELIANKKQLLSEVKNEKVNEALSTLLQPLENITNISKELDIKILGTEGLLVTTDNEKDKEAESFKAEILPLINLFNNKEEIEKLEQQIIIETSKLDKINAYEEELKIKKFQKDEAKSLLIREYRQTLLQYTDIVSKLNERGADITGDLKLKGSVKFYTKRFYERLREAVNNKQSASYIDNNNLFSELKDINDVADETSLEIIIGKLNLLFDYIIEEKIVLKSAFSKKDALMILFKDEFFDYWEILSGRDEIANMSPGKAGLVLLKLLIELSDSKCPILIDQPEDNLDNRSIYTDLVQYIRDKKFQRQFIVVTHNPNIVVGADSENVIIANQNDQDPARKNELYQFDYINGALEQTSKKSEEVKNILTCMGIREHVSEILEGGKEAFQKRELKYRYTINS